MAHEQLSVIEDLEDNIARTEEVTAQMLVAVAIGGSTGRRIITTPRFKSKRMPRAL